MIIPVLLAGGEGTRLWPLSNGRTPKQFLSVISNDISLYQSTVGRVSHCVSTRSMVTVTSKLFSPQINEQFKPFETVYRNHVIVEPFARNTAAAVVLAALYAQERFGDALLWVVPSDHVIKHPDRLKTAIEQAIPYAKQGDIITFGVTPTRADPHYGYIVTGNGRETVLDVEQFLEKPSVEMIAALKGKRCFWNSGMFLFSVQTLLAEMENYGGDILASVTQAYHAGRRPHTGMEITPEYYGQVASLPIDKVIMEHSKKLKTVPVEMGWADVGSWQSLWEFTDTFRNGSVGALSGVSQGECGNCLSYMNKRLALTTY